MGWYCQDIKTGDWSAEVQPFWGAVIQTALTPQGFTGLLKAGAGTLRGALVMPLMKTVRRVPDSVFSLTFGLCSICEIVPGEKSSNPYSA